MKSYFLPLFYLLLFSLIACESDFQVTSEWKETTIVYAILNQNDDRHYVRVQKAFLDEETSAIELAQISDSLYHQYPIEVKFEILNEQGDLAYTIPLELVNADTLAIMKEEGDFGTTPYLLYSTNAQLESNREIRLVVDGTKQGRVSAVTSLINDFEIFKPAPSSIDFPTKINLNTSYSLTWNNPNNAALFDLFVRVFYSEDINSTITNKTLDWPIFNSIVPSDGFSNMYDIIDDSFQGFLFNNLEENLFAERQIDSLQFHFFVGTDAIRQYNEALVAQQSTVTSGGSTPNPYSNVENGLGLFASRFDEVVEYVLLTNQTADSLVCHPLTQNLSFKPITQNLVCP